jgi:hypothetical protein
MRLRAPSAKKGTHGIPMAQPMGYFLAILIETMESLVANK